MRKLLYIILVANLLLTNYAVPTYAEDSIHITLNGKSLVGDQTPVMQNDRVLVPMRLIFEAIGADVYWRDENQEIIAVKNNIKVFMHIGIPLVLKYNLQDFNEYFTDQGNIENCELNVEPQIISDKAMVPIRAIESMGVHVDWNDESNTVILTCDESFITEKNQDKIFINEYLSSFKGIFPHYYNDVPLPNNNLPPEVQKLSNEIYNSNNSILVFKTIVEYFGEPTGDDGGPGLYVPYWKVHDGKLSLIIVLGVIYENDAGYWNLMKRKSLLGDVIKKRFNISSVPIDNSYTNIGELLLKDDNTYLFSGTNRAVEEYSNTADKPFFFDNTIGSWKIEFEKGFDFDTDIDNVMDGTVLANIIFSGINNNNVVVTVKKIDMGVEYISDSANCTFNNHMIDNPFTIGVMNFL